MRIYRYPKYGGNQLESQWLLWLPYTYMYLFGLFFSVYVIHVYTCIFSTIRANTVMINICRINYPLNDVNSAQ